MSVFTSRVTLTVPVPHDEGQAVTIRKLAPRHLEQAAKAQQAKSMADLKAMGGATFIQELRGLSSDAEDLKAAKAAAADPLLLYDRVVLMEKAIITWTYEEPVTVEALEDLDDQTADLLARAILRLAKPSAFQTPAEADDAQKKDFAGSTLH